MLGVEHGASYMPGNAPPLSYTSIPTFYTELRMSEGFPELSGERLELSKSPPLIWLDGPGWRNALA